MNEKLFWQLIGRLGHDLEVNRLLMALTALSAAQFLGFGWHLRRAANRVDGPAHRRFAASATEHGLPSSSPTAAGSRVCARDRTPSLQEVQTTVVALGHDVWSAVLTTPALLDASWPVELGRKVEALSVRQHLWDLDRGLEDLPGSERGGVESA